MRIVKEPEVRKSEIIDAAEKLFSEKGFEAATVNDILSAVAIAKGTFYYYFKSKEEVLDAIIQRRINSGLEAAKKIAEDSALSPEDKIIMVLLAQQSQTSEEQDFLPVVHEPVNALFHQKIITGYILALSPILSDIVVEGIAKKRFRTMYPRETIEILLASGLILFDDAYFRWTKEEKTPRISAYICAMERLLGSKSGNLSRMAEMFTADSVESFSSLKGDTSL
jgi:AcrR family transcriptional regulator